MMTERPTGWCNRNVFDLGAPEWSAQNICVPVMYVYLPVYVMSACVYVCIHVGMNTLFMYRCM